MTVKSGRTALARSKFVGRILGWAIFSLFVFSLVLWFALPSIARTGLNQYFADQGIHFSAQTLALNFYPFALIADDVNLVPMNAKSGDTASAPARIDRLYFELKPLALFDRRLHVTQLYVEGVNVSLEQQADTLLLAGLRLATSSSESVNKTSAESKTVVLNEDSGASKTTLDFLVAIEAITLRDIQFQYQNAQQQSVSLVLNKLLASRIHYDLATQRGALDYQLKLTANTKNTLDSLGEVTFDSSELHLVSLQNRSQIQFESWGDWLPDTILSLGGKAELNGAMDLAVNLATTPVTVAASSPSLDLTLEKPHLKQKRLQAGVDKAGLRLEDVEFSLAGAKTHFSSKPHLILRSIDVGLNTAATESETTEGKVTAEQIDFTGALKIDKSTDELRVTLDSPNSQLHGFQFQHPEINLSLTGLNASTSKIQIEQSHRDLVLKLEQPNVVANNLNMQSAQQSLSLSLLSVTNQNTQIDIADEGTKIQIAQSTGQLRELYGRHEQRTGELKSMLFSAPKVSLLLSPSSTEVQYDLRAELDRLMFALEGQKLLATQLELALTDNDVTLNPDVTQFNSKNAEFISKGVEVTADQTNLHYQTITTRLNELGFTLNQDGLFLNGDVNGVINGLELDQPGANASIGLGTVEATISLQQRNQSKLALGLNRVKTNIDQVDIKVAELNVNLDRFAGTLDQITFDQGQGTTSFNAQDGTTRVLMLDITTASDDTLLSVEQLDTQLQQARWQGDNWDVRIDQQRLNMLTGSQMAEAQKPLVEIGEWVLNNIHLTPNDVTITSVNLANVTSNVDILANQTIDNMVSLPSSQEVDELTIQPTQTDSTQNTTNTTNTKSEAKETGATKTDPITLPIHFAVDKVLVGGDNYLYLNDFSVTPVLRNRIRIDELSLYDIDSQQLDKRARYTFALTNSAYAKLRATGTVLPFKAPLTMTLDLDVSEAELPPYSPYLSDVLGYKIASGQLNMAVDLTAEDGALSGNSHVVLRSLDLGNEAQSNNLMKVGAIPLNLAVGFLKDGDGVIELDVPLKGDITNPQFEIQSFLMLPIRRALYKASTSYMMQTFVPYANVVSIAQFAGEQLLRIRVKPLTFEPGTASLEGQEVYVAELTALLKDKSASEARLCGYATAQDQIILEDMDINATEAQQVMYQLAQDRADILKATLVANGIESTRLYLCAPEIEQGNELPRVELNF